MLRMGEVEEKTGRPVCRLLGSKMDREVGGPGDGGTCGGKKSENGRIWETKLTHRALGQELETADTQWAFPWIFSQ